MLHLFKIVINIICSKHVEKFRKLFVNVKRFVVILNESLIIIRKISHFDTKQSSKFKYGDSIWGKFFKHGLV